jgi:oligopeptide transport system permease protein
MDSPPMLQAVAGPTLPRALLRGRGGLVGTVLLMVIALPCLLSVPWSMQRYHVQSLGAEGLGPRHGPALTEPMGTDALGRSLLWRCLLGGAISLGIGAAAAGIAVGIGVIYGAASAFAGGRVDAVMMRTVDVLYGLPYILLVVLLNLALQPWVERLLATLWSTQVAAGLAGVVTLLAAIGSVSWLTMARVIRGQVLSLRGQPFIEAARACGVGPLRLFASHLLPNLIGPIVVYTTLTVPTAILQESFLSFLGIGVQAPLPSWGNLAAEGVSELTGLVAGIGGTAWWLLAWPCALLGLTLLGLNLAGDALRDRLDPRMRGIRGTRGK